MTSAEMQGSSMKKRETEDQSDRLSLPQAALNETGSTSGGPFLEPKSNHDNPQQSNDEFRSLFSHAGAKSIAELASDGDGPYRCRKCGYAVLSHSVVICPACDDPTPWFRSWES
ncbi:hypothetical protein BGW80DRAFT_1453796 [Lactifluus volemus]|nr:hypothetical protein BGW80DRAFT_1453796 [Lactifluus volemus]